jgi:uncharacterized protein
LIAYIDPSAFLKLVIDEPESDALVAQIRALRSSRNIVASSRLLVTEAHRAVPRVPQLQHGHIAAALRQIRLVSLSDDDFLAAGMLAGESLRSLDAMHIAAAVTMGASAMLSYDVRQIEAATRSGLDTLSPG